MVITTADELTVRLARPDEVDRVQSFYLKERHRFVDTRSDAVLQQVVSSGNQFLIERDDAIVGASTLFQLDRKLTELGACRLAFPGFRLFEMLTAIQVLYHFRRNGLDARVIMNIDRKNSSVLQRVRRLGWLEFMPDMELLATHYGMVLDGFGIPVWWGYYPCDRLEVCRLGLRRYLDGKVSSGDGKRQIFIRIEDADLRDATQ